MKIRLRKILSFMLVFSIVFTSMTFFDSKKVSASGASGTWKKDGVSALKWEIEDGKLTLTALSGLKNLNGYVSKDNYSSVIPWQQYKGSIKSIAFADSWKDITDMNYWFAETSVENVTSLPEYVKSLKGTFLRCDKLTSVEYLPTNCTNLQYTFSGCSNLKYVLAVLPENLTSLNSTFKDCENLIYVSPKIPATVTAMTCAFQNCKNLSCLLNFADSNSLTAGGIENMLAGVSNEVYISGASGTTGLKYDKIRSGSGYTGTTPYLTLKSIYVDGTKRLCTLAIDANNNLYAFGNQLTMFKNANSEIATTLSGITKINTFYITKGIQRITGFNSNVKSSVKKPASVQIDKESFSSVGDKNSIKYFNNYLSGLTVKCSKKQYDVFNIDSTSCKEVNYVYPSCLRISNFSDSLNNYEGHSFDPSTVKNTTIEILDTNGCSVMNFISTDSKEVNGVWEYSMYEKNSREAGSLTVNGPSQYKTGYNVYAFSLNVDGCIYKGESRIYANEINYKCVDVSSNYSPCEEDIFNLDDYIKGIDKIVFTKNDGSKINVGKNSVQIETYENESITLKKGVNKIFLKFTYDSKSITQQMSIVAQEKKVNGYKIVPRIPNTSPVAVVGKDKIVEFITENFDYYEIYENGTKSSQMRLADHNLKGINLTETFNQVGTQDVTLNINGEEEICFFETRAADLVKIKNVKYNGKVFEGESISMKDLTIEMEDEAGKTIVFSGDTQDLPGNTTSTPVLFSIDTRNVEGNDYIYGYLHQPQTNQLVLNISNSDIDPFVFYVIATPIAIDRIDVSSRFNTLIEGQKLNSNDVEMTLILNNGKTEKTTEFEIDPDYEAIAGETTDVIVKYVGKKYKEYSDICHGTVSIAGLPKSIENINATYNGPCVEGIFLDKKDFNVEVFYNNDTSETISDFELEDMVLSLEQNTAIIKVTKNDETFTKEVYITGKKKTLKDIKVEYVGTVIENCEIDKNNILVTLFYDNNTSEVGSVDILDVSDYNIEVGTNVLTVQYLTIKSTMEVTGTENVIISVDFIPEKTIVVEGYKYSDLRVFTKYNYADGTTENGNTIYIDTKGYVKQGVNKLHVSHLDFDYSFEIKGISNNFSISSKAELIIGKNLNLSVSADNKSVLVGQTLIWKSSDSNIVTVKDGNIKGVAPGTATVSTEVFGHKLECKVTVIAPCENLKLKNSSVTLYKGKKTTLSLTKQPFYTTDSISWLSSNKKIATVTQNGTVTAKNTGSCYVVVTASSGITKKCKINVVCIPNKITLNKKTCLLKKGKSIKLKYSLTKGSVSSKVKWTSSNKKIAKVDKNGKVTALKKGKVVITVTTYNKKKDTCVITVK